jgi:hypothetical protein
LWLKLSKAELDVSITKLTNCKLSCLEDMQESSAGSCNFENE